MPESFGSGWAASAAPLNATIGAAWRGAAHLPAGQAVWHATALPPGCTRRHGPDGRPGRSRRDQSHGPIGPSQWGRCVGCTGPIAGRLGRCLPTRSSSPISCRCSGVAGLTDLDPGTFRAAAHRVADLMADYLEGVEDLPGPPGDRPGSIRALFPAVAARGTDARSIGSWPTSRSWSCPTPPIGSTPASWPTSRPRPRAPGSWARC